ncbi:MAG: DUF5123 domain-containing protein [Planctomycetes bacterium]|nr:DUF5123 domain-containing protein [Planctomycetota bacterium]
MIDQLFINGRNQRMARYPNYDATQTTAAYQGYAADAFSKARAAGWADPTGGYIHAMHTTTIRSRRWRCDHGWDIDLDDGSSNYQIYNNLLLNGGLKFREGFQRGAWNNIMVNNSFHPHVWYVNSGDEFFGNIVMADVKGIRAPTNTARGKTTDRNLFFVTNPSRRDKYAEQGWDLNSIVADPLFVDPASGDFRVKQGSLAFKIGFKNFRMDQFGVKKASLKAVAKTPEIPGLGDTEEARVQSPAVPSVLYWLGAKVHGLVGEEFSAFGVRKKDGGVALMEVSDRSSAARAGLKVNDLMDHKNDAICRAVPEIIGLNPVLRVLPNPSV